jgi:hypothetical protein
MAYFIFLKYLRSLQEFKKNPHVKIPPKSRCANFQNLAIFKNLIFIQKGILFRFWPIRPSPTHPSRVGVFAEWRILFDFVHSSRDTFSLSSHYHVGPTCQIHPLPQAGRPLPLLLVASGHRAPPGLQPCDAKQGLHSTP